MIEGSGTWEEIVSLEGLRCEGEGCGEAFTAEDSIVGFAYDTCTHTHYFHERCLTPEMRVEIIMAKRRANARWN